MFPANSMEGSKDKCLSIGNQNLDPFHYFMGFFVLDHLSLMFMSTLANNIIGWKSVRLDGLLSHNICFYQSINGLTINIVDYCNLGIADTLSIGGSLSYHSGFGTPPFPFVSPFLMCTKERIVDFNYPCQLIIGILILADSLVAIKKFVFDK